MKSVTDRKTAVEVGPATYTESLVSDGSMGRGPLACDTVPPRRPTARPPPCADRVLRPQVATGPRLRLSTCLTTIPQILTFLLCSTGIPRFHKFSVMDIDDILREVDPVTDTIPAETRDLQALTRAWVAERCAPELLECANPSHALVACDNIS